MINYQKQKEFAQNVKNTILTIYKMKSLLNILNKLILFCKTQK